MISFALFAVTLFRFFLGKSILSYCCLSLNVSRISKTTPTSPRSLCFRLSDARARAIRYFKLNTASQDDMTMCTPINYVLFQNDKL